MNNIDKKKDRSFLLFFFFSDFKIKTIQKILFLVKLILKIKA